MLVSNQSFIHLKIFTQGIPTMLQHGKGSVTPEDHSNNWKAWGQKITSGFDRLKGHYFTSLTALNNQSDYTNQADKYSENQSKRQFNSVHSSQIESLSHLPHIEIKQRNSTTKISIQKSTHVPSNATSTMIPGKALKPRTSGGKRKRKTLKQVLESHLSVGAFLEIYNTTCPVKNISNICPCIPPDLGKSHFGTLSNHISGTIIFAPIILQKLTLNCSVT